MPNPVIHFEISGPEASSLPTFYSETFGWTINADNPMNYGIVETGEETGINGGIDAGEARATFYIEVDDPGAYLERVKAAGGTVAMDVVEIPDMVTFAQFKDPAGNLIGLVKSDSQ